MGVVGLALMVWAWVGRVGRLEERVRRLEEDAPLPDKHYAPDIDTGRCEACESAPCNGRALR
jgi:hypothetical protein